MKIVVLKKYLSNDEYTRVLYLSDRDKLFKIKAKHCNSTNPSIKEWEVPFIYYDFQARYQR